MNPDVIRLREEFSIPRDDDRFRVICADGAHYLAHLRRSKDVILADACDRAGIAPELDAIEFYQQVRRVLSQGGVFVSNMCGDRKNCNAHLSKIQEVFEGHFVTLQVAPHGNVIVLAFKDSHSQYDWGKLAATGLNLKQRFSLDFPRYVQRMSLDRKRCRWQ
jgi:spermidine synthase